MSNVKALFLALVNQFPEVRLVRLVFWFDALVVSLACVTWTTTCSAVFEGALAAVANR